jgi:hypothetical protein
MLTHGGCMQGIVGTGACYYLQTWCVGMEGPVFLAMWNPLSLLLTVLCSSLLGETVHLGRQGRPHSFICFLFEMGIFFINFKIVTSACTNYLFFFLSSILGGILLVGGLYCVLWGKNKEETLAAMASGHLEQSREQGDADAASCTSTSVIFKNQDEDKEAGGRLEPFNHIT